MSEKDLFLLHCRNNDEFAQCTFGTIVRKDSERDELLSKYRKCRHLFVVIKESEYIGAFHSSDCETIPERVECVHCGITNRLVDVEDVANDLHGDCRIREYYQFGVKMRTRSYVTEEFVRQFGWNNEGLRKQRFLSEQPLRSNHPGVLFQIAQEFYSAVRGPLNDTIGRSESVEESIFLIMKELHKMETSLEQFKISSVVQASALIERFKKKHHLYS